MVKAFSGLQMNINQHTLGGLCGHYFVAILVLSLGSTQVVAEELPELKFFDIQSPAETIACVTIKSINPNDANVGKLATDALAEALIAWRNNALSRGVDRAGQRFSVEYVKKSTDSTITTLRSLQICAPIEPFVASDSSFLISRTEGTNGQICFCGTTVLDRCIESLVKSSTGGTDKLRIPRIAAWRDDHPPSNVDQMMRTVFDMEPLIEPQGTGPTSSVSATTGGLRPIGEPLKPVGICGGSGSQPCNTEFKIKDPTGFILFVPTLSHPLP